MTDRIAILDFGSQFTQLIARRIRDLGVFTEIYPPWNANVRQVLRACDKPAVGDGELKGIILSGGPQSIYAENAPPTCKTTCWKSACPFWASATACKPGSQTGRTRGTRRTSRIRPHRA